MTTVSGKTALGEEEKARGDEAGRLDEKHAWMEKHDESIAARLETKNCRLTRALEEDAGRQGNKCFTNLTSLFLDDPCRRNTAGSILDRENKEEA